MTTQKHHPIRSTRGRVGRFTIEEEEHYYPWVSQLIGQLHSDRAIARITGLNDRTILRYRQKRNIDPNYAPTWKKTEAAA